MTFILNQEVVSRVLTTVDAGLVRGLGVREPGMMCVEAAVCYALGLPHNDDPKCVDPLIRLIKISLNDSKWSSNKKRAEGLRNLAVLQLGTKGDFDQIRFVKELSLMIIKEVLPLVLKDFPDPADNCKTASTLEEGISAASAARDAAKAAGYAAGYAADAADAAGYAARYAADAARYAADAARYAADAARYAADAAGCAVDAANAVDAAGYAADTLLFTYSKGIERILIRMEVPGARYLALTD